METVRPPGAPRRSLPIVAAPVPAAPPRPWWRRADPLALTLGVALGTLGLLAPAQVPETVRFALGALLRTAPWLAGSVAFAAWARVTGADGLIARAFAGRESRGIVAAALGGALSPFCSCGVVPLVAGLLGSGVPLAPVMAFWVSSPLMDPNMFVVTATELGLGFALARTAAAIGLGLAGGFATLVLDRAGGLAEPLRRRSVGPRPAGPAPGVPAGVAWGFWRERTRRRRFLREMAGTGGFLLRWLALAFALEGLLVAYAPASLVAAWLGGGGASIPLAVAVGIPAYLNGFAAVPLVSALVRLGMSPAAGLAFLMAGGVTSVPAAVAVAALVRPRVFLWYLAIAVTGALAAGYAYAAALRWV